MLYEKADMDLNKNVENADHSVHCDIIPLSKTPPSFLPRPPKICKLFKPPF